MTINDLIERLEDYRNEIGGDAEVRLMTQQNWPFENSIYGLASGVEINDESYDDEDPDDDGDVDEDAILYIVEGSQLGYRTIEQQLKSAFKEQEEPVYWLMSLRRGQLLTEARLKWCQECKSLLQQMIQEASK